MKAYLGIDPGLSGGLAIIAGEEAYAVKMPPTEKDLFDLVVSFRGWKDRATVAVLEAVHAMPKQGVTSSFNFGKGYGGLRMALIAAEIPFRDVSPAVWQKALGCLSRGKKNVTKSRAQQLFPTVPKITHATADALLLAEWLRRQYEQP